MARQSGEEDGLDGADALPAVMRVVIIIGIIAYINPAFGRLGQKDFLGSFYCGRHRDGAGDEISKEVSPGCALWSSGRVLSASGGP